MNSIKYLEYDKKIRKVAESLIGSYVKEKHIFAGVNGPYNDLETEVRNLCHLIVITAIECSIYNKKELKQYLFDMGEKLITLSKNNGLYILRNKEKKDQSNGVIGHAWVIEAFVYLYKVFRDKKYIDISEKIYCNHRFNKELGLWYVPECEKIDYTFNHQLWFAASVSELYYFSKNEVILNDLEVFFSKLIKNMKINNNGLIGHLIIVNLNKKQELKENIKHILDKLMRVAKRPSYKYKEVGYHIFNMTAFGRIYKVFPDKMFWESNKVRKSIKYLNSRELLSELTSSNINMDISLNNVIDSDNEKEINIYGYPYNVPGFELYYLYYVFAKKIDEDIVKNHLENQFQLTFNEKKGEFENRCFDKITINYRIYEYYKAIEERDHLLRT